MNTKPIIFLLIVLTIASLACGVTVDLPGITQVKTGPTQTSSIQVPLLPESEGTVAITLEFGAGRLLVDPGADDLLVEGEATYNVTDFKPTIEVAGNQVTISQGDLNLKGIPNFDSSIKNTWDLKLGEADMALIVKAGAYQSELELGGLNLVSLAIADGAAEAKVSFSEPNRTEMSSLDYKTGASEVTLKGLANANFETMKFRGGAGSYTLDFSGDLKRDAEIDIDAGVSSVVINVPKGMSAELIYTGALLNIDTDGDWEKTGGRYVLEGDGPKLTFNLTMGAGSLELTNR